MHRRFILPRLDRWSPRPGALRGAGRLLPSRVKLTASVVLVEDIAQFAGEGFGLAGVSGLAAHEATVMAGEHRRLLTKSFGGGPRRTSGAPAHGLLAHGDHDARR